MDGFRRSLLLRHVADVWSWLGAALCTTQLWRPRHAAPPERLKIDSTIANQHVCIQTEVPRPGLAVRQLTTVTSTRSCSGLKSSSVHAHERNSLPTLVLIDLYIRQGKSLRRCLQFLVTPHSHMSCWQCSSPTCAPYVCRPIVSSTWPHC
jgi:hypothetical protein